MFCWAAVPIMPHGHRHPCHYQNIQYTWHVHCTVVYYSTVAACCSLLPQKHDQFQATVVVWYSSTLQNIDYCTVLHTMLWYSVSNPWNMQSRQNKIVLESSHSTTLFRYHIISYHIILHWFHTVSLRLKQYPSVLYCSLLHCSSYRLWYNTVCYAMLSKQKNSVYTTVIIILLLWSTRRIL